MTRRNSLARNAPHPSNLQLPLTPPRESWAALVDLAAKIVDGGFVLYEPDILAPALRHIATALRGEVAP